MLFEKKKPVKQSRHHLHFDYKDPLSLYSFIEGAKITPARTNGLTSKQERLMKKAIKKARNLGLLPTHFQSFDDFGRPEMISHKPFKYK